MSEAKILIMHYQGGDVAGALKAALAQVNEETQVTEAATPHCPFCRSPVASRERRPNGNDKCEQGHVFPSSKCIYLEAT
jgi:hypothetical protein